MQPFLIMLAENIRYSRLNDAPLKLGNRVELSLTKELPRQCPTLSHTQGADEMSLLS